MKFVHYKQGAEICLGIKTETGIIDVKNLGIEHNVELATTIDELFKMDKSKISHLQNLITNDIPRIDEEKIVYAPCVTHPEKILCVGLNYADHAAESNMELPTSPVLFSKFNNALAAHNQVISLPKDAKKVDYEAELVIVIGKEVKAISKEEAPSAIFGYTIGNDVSARDLQFLTGQWLVGKTCDGFAPIGPYLITSDELDPSNLAISCKVNGEIRQVSNTNQLIFDCATIVSYASQYMTLKPGDLIFTGTPAGVMLGYPEGKQQWLKSGDEVAVTIEKIGTLFNIFS